MLERLALRVIAFSQLAVKGLKKTLCHRVTLSYTNLFKNSKIVQQLNNDRIDGWRGCRNCCYCFEKKTYRALK
jgi:hypothetical protein